MLSSLAFTAFAMTLMAIALYFAYRNVRGEFWRVLRRQRRAIAAGRRQIDALTERIKHIESVGTRTQGEIKPPRSKWEALEDRHVKAMSTVVGVNGQPTIVPPRQ